MSKLLAMMMRKKIPAIYKVLDWIQSDGYSYINTGYKANIDDIIETDLQRIRYTLDFNDNFFFGIQNIDTTKGGLWVEQVTGSNKWYVRFCSTSSANATCTNADQNNKIHITLKKESFVTSGGTTLTPSFAGTINDTSLTLFGRISQDGNTVVCSIIKMWNFYITRNGSMKLNLIPVRRLTDNEVGMYDTVSKQFFGNVGTGKFIGSDEMVLTKVGSPTITDGVVSGFSGIDYLKKIQTIENVSIEYKLEFTTGSSLSGNQELLTFFKSGSGFALRSFIQNGTDLLFFTEDDRYFHFNYTFSTETTYKLKVEYNGDKTLIVTLYNSSDTQLKTQTITMTTQMQKTSQFYIGSVGQSSSIFGGSIDLNNSYIKIDGTKYIFTIGA